MLNPFYGNNKILQEDPVDIYISSSWIDDGHWMWSIVDNAIKDMLDGGLSIFLAFDESITLIHHLKTLKQLIKERKKQDPTTWKIEFLNLRLKESLSSYFTYKMLSSKQTMKQVFYPRNAVDFKMNKRNKYAINKQDGEIRIISNDIAFVAGSQNDNSVYTCMRGIPETITYQNENNLIEVKKGLHRQVPYIESNQLGDTTKQAVRIRQLYEDFDADFIVLDTRSGGIGILYALEKVLYDEERGVEYPPLKCMNNEDYANFCQDPNARPCIFSINASQQLNSDIAIAFRKTLVENKIDLLVNFNTAKEEILNNNQEYTSAIDEDTQLEFEKPFLETQAMIDECVKLQYEKLPQTNTIKVYEQGKNRKDRYTSISYGSYFMDLQELDSSGGSEYDFCCLVN